MNNNYKGIPITNLVRNETFNFVINSPWSQEGGINEVGPAGGGQNVDAAQNLDPIQLREELVHHSVRHTCVVVTTPTKAAERINFNYHIPMMKGGKVNNL